MPAPQARPPTTGPIGCAVVTMELQRGVVGDLAALPELAAEVAARGTLETTARLVAAARARHVPVVHCIAEFRADRAGSLANAPLLAALAKNPAHLLVGSPAAQLVPALGPASSDLVESRLHGISPFGGTSLDATLRSLRVDTVVVAGVSVNLGIFGLVVEAINLGYTVVVPTDAVAGVPRSYAEDVLRHSISLLARLTTVDAVTASWAEG